MSTFDRTPMARLLSRKKMRKLDPQGAGLPPGRLRRAATLALVVALGTSVAASSLADSGPTGLGDEDAMFVPLRWCALEGTSAATNPGAVGESDTDGVLWRRHERATDFIWFPGALISFRSAFVSAVAAAADFPIIRDPKPPPQGPGSLGDIEFPSSTELQDARASCLTAWDRLEQRFGANMEGPVVLNIRRFVTSTGSTSSTSGFGTYYISWAGGGTNPCTSEIVSNAGDNAYAAVIDNSFTLAGDPHDRNLAHELGHVLFLGHGNGLDDDGDGFFDGCDGALWSASPPDELNPTSATPPSLMTYSSSELITTLQRGTVATGTPGRRAGARGIAKVTSGMQYDPAGALVNGPIRSDHRVDRVHDAPPAIDIVTAGIATNDDLKRSTFTHSLFGLIPDKGRFEYSLFLDLDGRSSTGGSPAGLGFPTAFQGAELVTDVTVLSQRRLIAKAWRYRVGTFVALPRGSVRAFLSRSIGEDGKPLFDSVGLHTPTTKLGPLGARVGMQALARTRSGPSRVDRMPDVVKDIRLLLLKAPAYPRIVVQPGRVQRGGTFTIIAQGLMPKRVAKIFIGDQRMKTQRIDGKGAIRTNVTVPTKARLGARLITVGVEGKALSADALLVVTR